MTTPTITRVHRPVHLDNDWSTEHELHEFFGRDANSYNLDLVGDGPEDPDGSGRHGINLAMKAIAFWAGRRDGELPTIGEAAAAFRMPAEAVAQAVRAHPFLLVGSPDGVPLHARTIEQDGE